MNATIIRESSIQVQNTRTNIWELLLEIEGLAPIDPQKAYHTEKARKEEIKAHNESLTPVLRKDLERAYFQANKWERRYKFMIRELESALG